jgi:hypothetical protein
LDHERYEREEEDDENGDNASVDPVKDRLQVGTTSGIQGICDRDVLVVVTHDGLIPKRSEVDQTDHEHLDRQHNKQVVEMESRMSVVE